MILSLARLRWVMSSSRRRAATALPARATSGSVSASSVIRSGADALAYSYCANNGNYVSYSNYGNTGMNNNSSDYNNGYYDGYNTGYCTSTNTNQNQANNSNTNSNYTNSTTSQNNNDCRTSQTTCWVCQTSC